MAGSDELTKTKEQQAEPITVQRAETLREHLISLQQWNVPAGQTLEETRRAFGEAEEQRSYGIMQRVWTSAQQQLPPANAAAAAPGAPVQQQAPAKKSYKERREEKKHTKKARRENPNADYVSYDIVKSLKTRTRLEESSVTPEIIQRAVQAGCDLRVLRIFCSGYWKDKKGEPADDAQQRLRDQDRDWIDAYTSRDLQRMKPHLTRFVDEILSYEVTPDMLTAEYMRKNAARVKVMNDRMTYIENLQKDPVTAPFFQQLDPMKLARLNNFTNLMTGPMGTAIVMNCAAHCVNANDGDFDRTGAGSAVTSLQDYQTNADVCIQMIDGINQQIEQANNASADALIEQQLPDVLREFREQADDLRGDIDLGKTEKDQIRANAGLTSFVTEYSFDIIADAREVIESHPAEYGQHREIVDKIYEQLHHTADAMGDITLLSRAYQHLQDSYNAFGSKEEHLLSKAANRKVLAMSARLKPYSPLLGAYQSALNFLLAGGSLGHFVRDLLIQMGMKDADLPPAEN